MKNFGWGDAMIAAGIIGGIICTWGAFAVIASGGGGILAFLFVVLALFAGPRLVIKGIHQKAADIKTRREATSLPPL